MALHKAATGLGQRFPLRRAFITGAGSGLGSELARALDAANWCLGLADISGPSLEKLNAGLSRASAAPETYVGDVASDEFVSAAVGDFARKHGGLDVMINNAGVAVAGATDATSVTDWRWIVEINLLGVVWGCRAAIPVMRDQKSGLILNVASSAGFAAAPRMSAYNVTKSGVISLSETMSAELAADGVQVSVAMPGFFRTGLLDRMRAPAMEGNAARKLMQGSNRDAAEAAQALLRGAERKDLYIVWPREYRWLWRLKRLFPMIFLKLARSLGERQFAGADRPRR
jgi:NAD(P)-dependent dehydrogenase (short-subunit alcohol dehydrogenase family)